MALRVDKGNARRVAGAAGVAYVAAAAVENVRIQDLPGHGAWPISIHEFYVRDEALSIVTATAGLLSLAAYAVFVWALFTLLRPEGGRLGGWALAGLVGGLAGAALAAAGVAAGGSIALDPSSLSGDQLSHRFDLSLSLRMVAGAFTAAFLAGTGVMGLRTGFLPRRLAQAAVVLSAPLALGPVVALTWADAAWSDALEMIVLLAFALHAVWVLVLGLWLLFAEGSSPADFIRRAAYLVLVIAAGLIGIALLAVPGATGTFFSWGLGPEPLAAFAGGVYVGAAALYGMALARPFLDVRGLVLGAAVLSVSVLAITLTHLDQFDLDRLQALAWLVLFVGFSALMLTLLVIGSPKGGTGGIPLNPAPRMALRIVALLLGALAAALWIDPTGLTAHSPFDLPPLGGRFAGSWIALLAVLAAWAGATGDRGEARAAALALVTLPTGALIAALRTCSDLSEGAPRWIYVAALLALVTLGCALFTAAQRPPRETP
jgi:hypothetical protein